MNVLEMRVTDRSVLALIRLWLRTPVEEHDGAGQKRLRKPEAGTPQGGVISPLISNAYLHWLDKLFMDPGGPGAWAGARIVRYADDFQVFAHRVTPQITAWISDLVERRMGLTINVGKTSTRRVVPGGDALEFLGYRMRWDRSQWPGGKPWLSTKPSPRSRQRFRDRVHDLTGRNRGSVPIDRLCGQVNRYLIGWMQYFGEFHRGKIMGKADGFVYDRMIRHLKRRSQRGVRPSSESSWYQAHLRASRCPQSLSAATFDSPPMKVVGKPDAGNPLVRFEEGGGPKGPSLLDVAPGMARSALTGAFNQ